MGSFNVHHYFSSDEKRETYKRRYLFSYNLVQALGWTVLLIQFICYYIFRPDRTLYNEVKYPLILFQNLAFLEFFHAYLQLTKSNPVVTFQQLYSRIMIVCGILVPTQHIQDHIGFSMLMFAWSFTEVIRYFNYALSQIGQAPYFLVWIRYTAFIVLYPIGVTGEMLCMFWAVDYMKRTNTFCIELPNKWNVVFYYYHYIIFNMSLYIPYFPQLYMHMFTQRKKALRKPKDQ